MNQQQLAQNEEVNAEIGRQTESMLGGFGKVIVILLLVMWITNFFGGSAKPVEVPGLKEYLAAKQKVMDEKYVPVKPKPASAAQK